MLFTIYELIATIIVSCIWGLIVGVLIGAREERKKY